MFVACVAIGTVAFVRYLRRRGMPRSWQVGASLVLPVIAAFAVHAAEAAGETERARLRTTLEGLAPTYAASLEALGYEGLSLDTAADDELYLRLIEQEKTWLRINPSAHDIYTFHRTADGGYALVLDSETDYDGDGVCEGEREERTDIGEDFEADGDTAAALAATFAGQATFQDVPSVDRWGVWVSSYAPIHDARGEVIAVLGVDYDASTWLTAILDQRVSTLCYFAVLFLLAVGFGTTVLAHRERQYTGIIAAKNAELQATNEKLEAASRVKSEFLTNMSHELRTPLTAILGFADLLGEPEQAHEERLVFVETIRRSGRHLLTVLSDILDLSKIEAGVIDLQLEAASPAALATETVHMLAKQARQKGLTLAWTADAEAPRAIACDPVRLRQILVNLVGNAIKFTDRGEVRIRIAAGPDDKVVFEVRDTGPGMTPEQLALLFQPFSQVDSSPVRRHGGAGLGLAISKRLALAHGGELEVQSEFGVGTAFRLVLPIGDPAALRRMPTAPADDAEAPAKRAKWSLQGRVLLVEDGPDNRRLVTHILQRAGLVVSTAQNGKEAVDRLLDPTAMSSRFDLVLMDMQMPVMDGYEATRTLRTAGLNCPIVALTANAMRGDEAKCLDAGCSAFVSKPIDRTLLLQTIAAFLLPV